MTGIDVDGHAVAAPDDAQRRVDVPVMPWPAIPREEFEVAQRVAALVQQSRRGAPPTVAQEEALGSDVARAMNQLIGTSGSAGFPLSVTAEIANNDRYQASI